MRFDTRAAFIQATAALFAIMTMCVSFSAAATFSDSFAGYSITLPEGWKDTSLSPKSRVFRDPANVYRAIVGVIRYDYDTALFDSERDWCMAMSAAYAISVESNPFFGFIYARDSTTHEGLFATYANAEYGMPIRSESIRWTARNRRGYELYVYTDTLDMYLHYALYRSFLESVHIFAPAGAVSMSARRPISTLRSGAFILPVNGKPPKTIPGFQGKMVIVNCAGRRTGSVAYLGGICTGIPSHNATGNPPIRMLFGIVPAQDK
jgi:hypothetical protein